MAQRTRPGANKDTDRAYPARGVGAGRSSALDGHSGKSQPKPNRTGNLR